MYRPASPCCVMVLLTFHDDFKKSWSDAWYVFINAIRSHWNICELTYYYAEEQYQNRPGSIPKLKFKTHQFHSACEYKIITLKSHVVNIGKSYAAARFAEWNELLKILNFLKSIIQRVKILYNQKISWALFFALFPMSVDSRPINW